MHTNNYKTDIDVSGIGTWLASELESTDIRILEDKGINNKRYRISLFTNTS